MFCYDYKSTDNTKVPKYTIHVVDSSDATISAGKKCAALITPQGREKESVFNTELGRQSLCTQTQMSRLIIIFLGHGHKFGNL